MNTFLRIAIVGAMAAGLARCSGPVEPKTDTFVYPLALGNEWAYEYLMITDYDEPRADDTARFTITATVAQVDTVLPGIYSYEIHEEGNHVGSPDQPPFVKAYLNLPDGMYRYYYRNPGGSLALPKTPAAPALIFRGRRYASVAALMESVLMGVQSDTHMTDIYYDPPRRVLPYPQHVGDRWLYVDSAFWGNTTIEKKITGHEKVTATAGTFDCYRIDWIYSPPPADIELMEFISEQGLVSRTAIARGVIFTSHDHPTEGDTVDVISTYELTSFDLN